MRPIMRKVSAACCLGILAAGLCGCESFVKKFRRAKPRDGRVKQVVAVQDYEASPMSSFDRYQQHFILWKAWQDELVDSLYEGGSRKRQLDALKQAMRSLEGMAGLLDEERSAAIAVRRNALKELEQALVRDIYGLKVDQYRQQAELLRSRIIRTFAPAKVKDALR